MLLGYVDDSSEGGTFLLAAVIVRDEDWLATLDAWTDYRRWLRQQFGYRIRKGRHGTKPVELHAVEFVAGSGEWWHCRAGRAARMRAYRVGLRLIGRHARVFAIAWVPSRASTGVRPPRGGIPSECWSVMLERFTTYSRADHDGDRVVAFVDDGYQHPFTQTMRRVRRHHHVGSRFGGSLVAPAPMLVDDPSTRDSKESAFIQIATSARTPRCESFARTRKPRASGRSSGQASCGT